MTKEFKRLHLWVSGTVQGVFFRHQTRIQAEGLGLTGLVRNLPDGRVEIIAEGTTDRLEILRAWARRGPPGAEVTGLEAVWEEPANSYSSFRVSW